MVKVKNFSNYLKNRLNRKKISEIEKDPIEKVHGCLKRLGSSTDRIIEKLRGKV